METRLIITLNMEDNDANQVVQWGSEKLGSENREVKLNLGDKGVVVGTFKNAQFS
jgi:hypothetical protein